MLPGHPGRGGVTHGVTIDRVYLIRRKRSVCFQRFQTAGFPARTMLWLSGHVGWLFVQPPARRLHLLLFVQPARPNKQGDWLNCQTGRRKDAKKMAATLPGTVFVHGRDAPDRVACEVWSPSRGVTLRVTFKELADNVCAAAAFLASSAAGVREGDLVAFLAHNCVAYVVLSLGAMTCDATSVNLNWRSPTATLEAICRDLGVTLLFSSLPFRQAAADIGRAIDDLRVMQIENVSTAPLADGLPFFPLRASEAAAVVERELGSGRDGTSTAAIFFTGGTTGMPKAVPHTHQALGWHAAALLAEFPDPFDAAAVPHTGTVCFTPFFHVMGAPAEGALAWVEGERWEERGRRGG